MSLVFNTPKTTLNTTTKDIQNVTSECPPCPECDLETGSAEYTENGSYTLSPEADGFSSVSITVDVPSDVNNQEKTVTITSNGQSTVTADSGYTGLSSVGVTVNVDTTTPYNEGYAAGETAQKAKLTSTTITENGTTTREDGFNSVTVNVQPDLETKTASYNANGQYTITPTAGKDGISEATVTVAVPSDVNNQNKRVTPTTSNQSVTADSGYSGLGTVTVEAVTSSIDANIAAGNIKKNVSILGVTGSYDPQPTLQAKTATPTTSQQVITPDAGNDGLSQVTISAVTAAIDENIQSENILSGVTILGVTGSDAGYTAGYDDGYAQGQAECPSPAYTPLDETITQNGTYTFDPTDYAGSSFDYFNEATITVNVSGGGTSCPDWSTIGWDCTDVTKAGVAADVAYTASVKNNNDWSGDNELVFAPTTSNSDAGRLFQNCSNLRYCSDLELTGTTASIEYLFYGCQNLTYVGDISRPNSANSATAANAFMNCIKLKSVGTIDMSNIETVTSMFNGCKNLTQIGGLSNLSSSVVALNNMFTNCASLTSLPAINTSNVTQMGAMFQNAYITQSMANTIGQWDTSNVENFSSMFQSTETSPNSVSSRAFTIAPAFDMSSASNVGSMFAITAKSNSKLTTIPQYNWGNVVSVASLFGTYGTNHLTTVGGFINLGKAFTSNYTSSHHLLDFTSVLSSASANLDHTSLMNIINNLAAPDDTNVNDATLKISSDCYNLLTAEEIAIATAKRWSVISA